MVAVAARPASAYTPQQQRTIIASAAVRHGIPPAILWGVFGVESDYGHNPSTSSAGAVGDLQFMPGTAAGLGINPYDFVQAADGAARYLAQFKSRGISGMLSAYNAGPAGGTVPSYVRAVLAKARTFTGYQNASFLAPTGPNIIGPLFDANPKDPLKPRLHIEPGSAADQAGGVIDAVGGGIGGALDAVGTFFKLLVSLDFWIRVGKAIAGITLIILGLKELGKTSGAGGAVAGAAGRAAAAPGKAATKAAAQTPAARAGKMRAMGRGARKPTGAQVRKADAAISRGR